MYPMNPEYACRKYLNEPISYRDESRIDVESSDRLSFGMGFAIGNHAF